MLLCTWPLLEVNSTTGYEPDREDTFGWLDCLVCQDAKTGGDAFPLLFSLYYSVKTFKNPLKFL